MNRVLAIAAMSFAVALPLCAQTKVLEKQRKVETQKSANAASVKLDYELDTNYVSLTLSWSYPTDWDVDHYEVYRSETSGFTPSKATLVDVISNEYGYDDNNFRDNATYFYKVIAIGLKGERVVSNELKVAVSLGLDIKAPVKLKLGDPTTSSRVSLVWSPYKGGDWQKFEVHKSLTPDFTPTQQTFVDSTEYNDLFYINRRLKPSTTYYYKVVVLTESGTKWVSNEVATKTRPPVTTPLTPSQLKFDCAPTPSRIDLTWNPSSAEDFDHYEIHKGKSLDFKTSKSTLVESIDDPEYALYIDESVLPGHTHYYKLLIFHRNGKAAASKVFVVKTPKVPRRPLRLSLQRAATAKEVRLLWTAQAEMIFEKYEVYRSSRKNSTPSDEGILDYIYFSTRNSFVDTGAKAGETVYYRVVFYGVNLEPQISNELEVKIPKR